MINKLLLNWYDHHARRLPWRENAEPYRVWISEIMLQQTRAEAVIPRYADFLLRFPDVFLLAKADEDAVLKCWEGLGYYSRARNLHTAARIIAARGGHFPDTVEELQALPGIGPYVARAIASIAFNRCVPALDGNQMRIIARLTAEERVLKTPFDLEETAQAWMSRERPGDYNQALMDLGSAVCTPKNPKCMLCPLRDLCRAHADNDPERYPLRPAPIVRREEERTVLLAFCGARVCVLRRPTHGLLGGLYDFPALDISPDDAGFAAALTEAGFADARIERMLPNARHVFTHLVWHMRGVALAIDAAPAGTLLVNAGELRALAFPSAVRVYREIAQNALDGLDAAPDTSPFLC